MKTKSVALILAKKKSNRLPGKNMKDFNGDPMFVVNVKKCIPLFDEVYVSSDSEEILDITEKCGAIPIKRGEELAGETPNITVYQHAQETMDADYIVAVQANSPTVSAGLIILAGELLKMGFNEVMTSHPLSRNKDYHKQAAKVYGSIWALSRETLKDYEDPYHPNPDVLLVDDSVDIETESDYKKALCQ